MTLETMTNGLVNIEPQMVSSRRPLLHELLPRYSVQSMKHFALMPIEVVFLILYITMTLNYHKHSYKFGA
jgi:thiosulfate reductase cytochrome b subunit